MPIFLGTIALFVVILLGMGFMKASPQTIASIFRGAAATTLILVAIISFIRGQGGIALAAAAAVPMILGWRRFSGSSKAPSAGQESYVETAWLSMRLNHDTGEADGEVRQGQFQARRLIDLNQNELILFYREIGLTDPQSIALLEAYLDRHYPNWRNDENKSGDKTENNQPKSGSHSMTREEAYQILGLSPGVSDAAVREAHRDLMKKLHPDQGGSNYLAAKVNAAKDLLIGE